MGVQGEFLSDAKLGGKQRLARGGRRIESPRQAAPQLVASLHLHKIVAMREQAPHFRIIHHRHATIDGLNLQEYVIRGMVRSIKITI